MKSQILTFSIATLAFSAIISCNSAKPFIPADSDQIVVMGRTEARPDHSVAFNYPGVTAMLRFDGPALEMQADPGSGYFMVEIDSLQPRKVMFGAQDSVLVVADSLPVGEHVARITYAVEGFEMNPAIRGFALPQGGEFRQAPDRPLLKLEFIGNSITCGYGSEVDDPSKPFDYATENFTDTYAYRVARGLDADFNVVARSGIGVYRNYGDKREGSDSLTMPREYGRTMLYRPDTEWDFSSFQPDVVLINLGTNDTSEDNYDIVLFENAYDAFLSDVRAHNPEAKIVLLCGPLLNGKRLDDVTGVLDRLAEKHPGVSRFDFTPANGSLGYGASWHPSRARHARMADELLDHLHQMGL